MFTDVYKKTTSPNVTVEKALRSPQVWASVSFHTLMYYIFVYIIYWAFVGKGLPVGVSQRVLIVLGLTMIFGYIARVMFIKQIYKSYGYDTLAAREHIDKHFIHWIFIG